MGTVIAKKTEYISRSYATLALNVSTFAQLFLGKIEGLTRFLTRKKAYMSYATIAEDFGVSERQAMRVVKKLVKMGLIEQVYDPKTQGCAYYYAKTKDEQRGFVSTPLYLKEKVFSFEYMIYSATGKKVTVYNFGKSEKDQKIEPLRFERTLTDIELTVLSLMATHGTYECTVSALAKTIGKSRTSVCNAIDALIHCGAILRPNQGDISKSRRDKSTYTVEETLLQEIKESLKTARNTPKKKIEAETTRPITSSNEQKSAYQKQIEDIDAKAEREQFYARLREQAQNKSDKVNDALKRNSQYKEADIEYKKLTIALAKADREGKVKEKRSIIKRRRQLSAIMFNIMHTMGYELADTKPQYRCKKCEDTGFDKTTGRSCSCYPKGGGRL